MLPAVLLALLLAGASGAAAAADAYVSPFVTGRLARILDWVDAGETTRALEALEQLAGRVRPGSGDDVLVTQQRVGLLNDLGRSREARDLLAATIARAPQPPPAGLQYLLGQFEAIVGDFEAADRALAAWLRADPDPSPQGLFLAGYVRLQREDWAAAADLVRRAMDAAEVAPAAWVEVRTVALLRSGRSAEAEQLLEARIARFPEETHWWRILARLALDDDRIEDAAVRMTILDAAGSLALADARRLAGLLASSRLPERGARVLAAALERTDGDSVDADDLMTLARLWIAAREWPRAVTVLERAAALTEAPEPLVVLGQTHLHWERYGPALEALEAARRREGEAPAGRTAWLLAIAAWNLGRLDTARDALEIARRSPGQRADAERLLRQLRDR